MILLFAACQKQELRSSNISTTDEKVVKTKQVVPLNSGSQWVAQIPYPNVSTVTALFQSDQYALQDLVNSNNEAYANAYVLSLADRIAGFYYYNKGIDIRNDFIDNPIGIVTLGLFSAAREYHYGNPSVERIQVAHKRGEYTTLVVVESGINCFLTAVGSIIGIPQAKDIWRSILAGASEETIIASVKLIGRRVATAITIVIAVYEIGECLEWW